MEVAVKIAVIPLSGYANRLQAIASTMALAERLGATLEVCWIPNAVAPARAEEVLDPEWAHQHVLTPEAFAETWGLDPLTFPPYLGYHAGHVTLAGYDRGEQALMSDLERQLPAASLVIRAGGHFTLGGDEARGRQERAEAYARLPLHPAVESRARSLAEAHGGPGAFVGVHIRLGDRSRETASPAALARATVSIAEHQGCVDVFVASDSEGALQRMRRLLLSAGLRTWDAAPGSRTRTDVAACHPALIDWRLLTMARAVAYSAASSFGEEATVAGRSWDISRGLSSTRTRRMAMTVTELAAAAMTYPRRHGWIP